MILEKLSEIRGDYSKTPNFRIPIHSTFKKTNYETSTIFYCRFIIICLQQQ